jgi:hypothetical protein
MFCAVDQERLHLHRCIDKVTFDSGHASALPRSLGMFVVSACSFSLFSFPFVPKGRELRFVVAYYFRFQLTLFASM